MTKYRINKIGDKYYVEQLVRESSFFRNEKWECCVFYNGLDKPFGYGCAENALNDFLSMIKLDIYRYSTCKLELP